MIEYSYSLFSLSMPSLKKRVEDVLTARPDIRVAAVKFETPDLYEMKEGRLHPCNPSWIVVSVYVEMPLDPKIAESLQRELEGEITNQPSTPVPTTSFLPVPEPQQPTGFTALDNWPIYFKLTPVVHVQPGH